MLSLKLFGGFQLCIDGKAIATKPRQREILAYLALKYPAAVTRQSIAVHLWPESIDSQAATNLRGHLSKLHEDIPQLENYLSFEGPELVWRTGVEISCDVYEFKRHLQSARQSTDESFIHAELEATVALYEGGLFPDCYSEWIVEDREKLRDEFVHLLERLGVLHESLRLYKEAIRYVRQLLRYEPQREEGYRLLMRLHAALGEFDEVRRVYQQCEQVLHKEFGAPPSNPTRELYHRLLQSSETQQHSPVVRIPLVGRHAVWQQLQKCWATVLKQGPHCVLLDGELGIGKSRLLEEMGDTLERRGFTVLRASCCYFDQQSSYSFLLHWLQNDLLRANLRTLDANNQYALAPLLPLFFPNAANHTQNEESSPGLQRTQLHEALSRLLLVKQSPILLVIDNLHWCDADSLDWLQTLLSHDRRAPLMVLCAASNAYPRQKTLASWRATLRQQAVLSEISMQPLTLSESQALATAASGTEVSLEEAGLLQRLSRGNPAHILDLLNSQTRLPAPFAEQIQLSLSAVFELLLAHLSAQALELLECAVMIGAPVTYAQLVHARYSDEEQLLLSLSVLVERCLLRELGDDRYTFTSELLPTLLIQRMSLTRQRYWRHRLGRDT